MTGVCFLPREGDFLSRHRLRVSWRDTVLLLRSWVRVLLECSSRVLRLGWFLDGLRECGEDSSRRRFEEGLMYWVHGVLPSVVVRIRKP